MTAARVGAAIDVGSNSVHLLVAAIGRTRLRPLVDESVQLGLGSVVDRKGRLGVAGRRQAVEVLQGYVARARSLGAVHVTIVGTEPLRRAADRSALHADVLRSTGVAMRVLTHEEEAALTLLGVTGGGPMPRSLLVLDIGGGSTELIVAGAGADPVVGAFAVGSARLAAAFIHEDPPAPDEIAALRLQATRLLATMPQAGPDAAVIAGGTGTNTNRLLGRLRHAALDARQLDRALAELTAHPAAELSERTGLTERRIRQLPAGITLVAAALARYELKRIAPSDASLREGAIHAAARAGDAWPDRLGALIGGPGS
ncbi:MAG: hypothetical protein U0869_10115 [Chloroflexota bacterium]